MREWRLRERKSCVDARVMSANDIKLAMHILLLKYARVAE